MSGQAELSQRFEQLSEIRDIMSAMKTLSLVETKKLTRFIGHQHRMHQNIEAAAADFSTYYPIRYTTTNHSTLVIVIGSERGFCGNFNEQIAKAFQYHANTFEGQVRLIAVGNRLGVKFETNPHLMSLVGGASIAEDVPHVIDNLMDSLQGASAIHVLTHDIQGDIVLKPLLPFMPSPTQQYASSPLLQLPPDDFLGQLLDQYLLTALYGFLYESLLSESRQRLAHMEQAIERLDKTISDLLHKRNTLRQEKIIEEIEVILAGEESSMSKNDKVQ